MTFEDLDLHHDIQMGLMDAGFREPTPIQAQAIPIITEGRDLIACAQTGTGKTGAFLIPLMSLMNDDPEIHIKGIILCPTRELAQQIDSMAEGFGYHSSVRTIAVYGGNKGGDNFSSQKGAIQSGADILIATPGRLLQHLTLGYVKLDRLRYLVLDEADRMLDMGFYQDLMRIVSYLPDDRQTLMFSATMPPRIRSLAKEIMAPEPDEINLALSKPAEGVDQKAFPIYPAQKIPFIVHFLKHNEVDTMIMFASRKSSVDDIVKTLRRNGIKSVEGMHSDRDQGEREKIMNDFRNRQVRILVATDILSRGIDVDNISHVLNFDVPQDAEDYVHRVGRTARASSTGEAITLITTEDMMRFGRIERLIEMEVPKFKLPEEIGEGPEYRKPDRRRRGKGGSGKKTGSRGGNQNRRRGGGGGGQRKDQSGRPVGSGKGDGRGEHGDQRGDNKPSGANKRRKKRRGGNRPPGGGPDGGRRPGGNSGNPRSGGGSGRGSGSSGGGGNANSPQS